MKSSKKTQDVLDKRQYGKTIRQHVREFGALFALIAFAAGALIQYKGGSVSLVGLLAGVGVLFTALGYMAPKVLYPLWKGWMAIAHVLGAIMTTIILTTAWIIMVVPLAIVLKVIGKKVMDLRYGAKVDSYWEPREEKYHDFKLLERQY